MNRATFWRKMSFFMGDIFWTHIFMQQHPLLLFNFVTIFFPHGRKKRFLVPPSSTNSWHVFLGNLVIFKVKMSPVATFVLLSSSQGGRDSSILLTVSPLTRGPPMTLAKGRKASSFCLVLSTSYHLTATSNLMLFHAPVRPVLVKYKARPEVFCPMETLNPVSQHWQ